MTLVFFVAFVHTLGLSSFFGTLIPFVFAKHSIFVTTEYNKQFLYSFLIILSPIVELVFFPIWGRFSDYFGARKVLPWVMSFSSLGYLLISFAVYKHILWIFVIAKVIISVSDVGIIISAAMIVNFSISTKVKIIRFNLQSIAISLGYVLGPYLVKFFSSTAGQFSSRYACIYMFIFILYFLIILVMLIRKPINEADQYKNKRKSWLYAMKTIRLGKIFGFKLSYYFTTAIFIYYLGWYFFFTYSGEYFYKHYHISNNQVNHIFSILGLWALFFQITVVGLLARMIKYKYAVIIAISLIGVALFLMGILNTINIYFMILIVVYCLGISIFMANINTYVAEMYNINDIGLVYGVLSGVHGVAHVLAGVLGGWFISVGFLNPLLIGGGLVFLALALMLLTNRLQSNSVIKSANC